MPRATRTSGAQAARFLHSDLEAASATCEVRNPTLLLRGWATRRCRVALKCPAAVRWRHQDEPIAKKYQSCSIEQSSLACWEIELALNVVEK